MKIPGGYGHVLIAINVGTVEYMHFRNIADNPVVSREISTIYTDVNDNVQKYIRGHHLDFNLQLVDYQISSGTQSYMINFLKYYYSQDHVHSDRRITIWPNYDSSASGWSTVQPYAFYKVVLMDDPHISDICNYKFTGQILSLKGRTRELISEDDYKVRIYRDSSDGAWGLLNAPQQGFIEPKIGVRT